MIIQMREAGVDALSVHDAAVQLWRIVQEVRTNTLFL